MPLEPTLIELTLECSPSSSSLLEARIAEALSVRWDDIDLRKRTVLIRQTGSSETNGWHTYSATELFIALANLPRDREPFAIAYTTARDAWERAYVRAGDRAADLP